MYGYSMFSIEVLWSCTNRYVSMYLCVNMCLRIYLSMYLYIYLYIYLTSIKGVTRKEDLAIIESLLNSMDPSIKERTDVVKFNMAKPSHLPFHSLAYAQEYSQRINCANNSHYWSLGIYLSINLTT
jgi:hypothetical protein